MGVELEWVCTSCQHHAWLGSAKPSKWQGFQAGNGVVVELLASHARGCRMIVVMDSQATDTPWCDDAGATAPGWLEDVRSRRCWDSIQTSAAPRWRQWMACGACERQLSDDFEDPRGARVLSPYLWFCDAACEARYLAAPGRVLAGRPKVSPGTRLKILCLICEVGISLGAVEPPELGGAQGEEVAWWVVDHVYRGESGAGLEGPGCRLVAVLVG